jgi:hypothetical protein
LALLVGIVGYAPANTKAQSSSGTPTTSELQTQVAEQEATISALETQVANLEDRINQLGESPETPAAEGEAGSTLAVGETWTGQDWEITVTGYELSPTIDSSFEQNVARGVFVLVYFEVTNTGNAPTPFPYDELIIKDSEGRSYATDWDVMFNLVYVIYENGSPIDPLQPGIPYVTAAAFDIPPTAVGLSFTDASESFTFTLE